MGCRPAHVFRPEWLHARPIRALATLGSHPQHSRNGAIVSMPTDSTLDQRIRAMFTGGLTPTDIAGILRNDATPKRISVATITRVIRETPASLYVVTEPSGERLQGIKEMPLGLVAYWRGKGYTVTPWTPCNCEHASHFPPAGLGHPQIPAGHEYMHAPAGERTIDMIGAVCDCCADNHQW